VKTDTEAIKTDTTQIKQDASQVESLVQQIGFLRLQLSAASEDDGRTQHLQRFLDQSTSYAETVVDAIEDDESPSEHLAETGEILENPEASVGPAGPTYGSVNGEVPSDSMPPDIAESDTHVSRTYTPVNSQSQRPAGRLTGVESEQIQKQEEMQDAPSTSKPESYTGFTIRDEYLVLNSARIRGSLPRKELIKLNNALTIKVEGKRPPTRIWPTDTDPSKWRGTASEIETLLDQGAYVHYKDPLTNEDILKIEMRNARPDIVEALLRHGAQLNVSDAKILPLRAAYENWTDLAKVALASGASPNTTARKL
jgi:hypothetical protein